MKPIYKKLILSIMLVSAFSLPIMADDVTVDSIDISSEDIAIIFTNDIHGGISSDFDFSGSSESLGFAGLMGVKADLLSKTQNVTTIDMGDAIQGTAVCTESNGSAIADLMDSIRYDIRIPGNHEFDFGMDSFLDYAKKTGTFLSCNFKHVENGPLFDSYKVISYDINGQEYKIGYVGMCTPETVVTSSPSTFQDENGEWLYSFSSDPDELLYETVQASIDAAIQEGADLIIGLGHMGDEGVKDEWSSYAIIQNTVGMSAFLDGHAHNVIPETWVDDKEGNPVLLTSTGTKLTNVGVMKIHIDENEDAAVQLTNNLVNTLTEEEMHSGAYLEVQEQVAAVEEKYMYMFIPIITSEFPFYDSDPETNERMIRCREMNIGDLLADAYRTVLNTDIAIISGGNIRASLNAGSITYLNLMSVLPWNSNVIALEATGQQILDALEMASRIYPDECGGFFQVSGMTYSIDPLVESSVAVDSDGAFAGVAGEYRVKDVKIGEENLDPEKTYTVAMNTFTALECGDGMSMFKECKIVVPVEDGRIDHDILSEYLKSCDDAAMKKYSDPYGQGRIVIIE